MAAAYLFHSGQISSVIGGARKVLDLGCGPATQLAQVASLNPQTEFIGVDLSDAMLDSARKHVAAYGITNVQFRHGDICNLNDFQDRSVDAVISTMALHHLPARKHLDACFREISRVVKPDGAVYLTDFGRLKSLRSVIDLAYMNAAHQPHIFSLDYERSLRAAFLYEEFAAAAGEYLPSHVRLYGTFMVPLLVILRTPPRPLAAGVAEKLASLRNALPGNYARDFEDLRRFFRGGGLRDDPFSAV
jgi:ubiquinone/menaquinone biosynthesis C-methylase UbiE